MKITDVKPKNDGKKYSVFDSVDKYWKSVEELQKKIEIKSDLDFTNPVNWRNSNTILPAIDYRLHKIQQFIAKRLLEKDKDNPLIIELFISNLAATGKNSESIRMEAKSILIDLGKLYDPQVIDALKQNLYHENSIIRQFSIEILLAKEGMAEDIDEVTHILIKNLSSLDATTRIRALERLTLLGKSDDSTVVDELTKNLRNNDGEVCRFATDTLISKNKNLSEIISNLMEMISVVGDAIAPSGEKWNAEEMRDFAMQKLAALDQLSKPEIIAELKKNLRSFDTEVRQFTIDTFLIDEEKAQPEVVAVLAKNLCSYKEQVRMKAMNTLISLKKMNDPQVVEVLKKNLSNRTKFGDARIFAFEALLQIKPFTSEIRWLLQENMVNDYKLKGELCWLTLELIDAPIKQRITQLENDLANEDVSVRQYSAERLVLVENITDKVMDVIFENTRASSNEVRDGASKTIAYLLELKKIERNEIINLYLNNLLSIYPHVRAHALINLKDMHCDESLISNKYLIYAQKKLDIPLEWIIELRSFNSLTDEIIAYLITLSINESFVVRQLAVDALGNTKQSGEIVISALVARLKDLKEIKLSAIDSLVKLGCSAPSVLSKLKPFLHDQNAEIRYSVAEAFVDLNCDLSIVSDVLDDLIDVILIDSQRALKASVP